MRNNQQALMLKSLKLKRSMQLYNLLSMKKMRKKIIKKEIYKI